MKKTDVAMIILIASLSVGVAYVIASNFIGGMDEQGVNVQTIDPITSTVDTPSEDIFNENAINPSVEVQINETESGGEDSTETDESES